MINRYCIHLSRVFVRFCVINKYVVFNLMAARGRATVQCDYTGSAVVHESVAADLQIIRQSVRSGNAMLKMGNI